MGGSKTQSGRFCSGVSGRAMAIADFTAFWLETSRPVALNMYFGNEQAVNDVCNDAE